MLLYKKINLKCFPLLQEYALEFSKNYLKETNGMKFHDFPSDLTKMLDKELSQKGLGKSKPPLYFFKKNFQDVAFNRCHIDGGSTNSITNLSLILPIRGCRNTNQYWFSGNYSLQTATDKNINYIKIVWHDAARFIDSVEICDEPILCNVRVPHAIQINHLEQRVTCTIRFQKNWSIEEIEDWEL